MHQSETQLVHAFMDWVHWKSNSEPLYSYMHHIVNEGKRSYTTSKLLKRAGMKSGLPDYNLPLPTARYAGLYIEFKTETGKLSSHQISWIMKLRAVGHLVIVARTLSDAQYITEEHIAQSKTYQESYAKSRESDGDLLGEFHGPFTPGGCVSRRLPVPRVNRKSIVGDGEAPRAPRKVRKSTPKAFKLRFTKY